MQKKLIDKQALPDTLYNTGATNMGDANDDGGPAFPVPSYVNADGETHRSSVQGMTLRDWFAGQALMGLIAGEVDYTFDQHVSAAYNIADAMLKARKGTQ